ncbi:MAG: polyamine aminopropyltransferase [Bdellovibrionales bacterium]
MSDSNKETWFEEKYKDYLGIRYRYSKSLFSGQSEFQKVDVVDTIGHGKMLFNDKLAMISERDEFVYHDMITHVPLFVHPNPKSVLVIGGGDGGTAREVLRHPEVEICVMVEIDEMVVDACKKHIPQTSRVFSNPKLDLKIEDGVKFVAETDQKFDVVIVDSTDPIGPAQPLFSEKFYGDVKRILNQDGIVVSQGESPFYNEPEQLSLFQILNSQFSLVKFYNFTNLTYPGGLWSFSFASNKLDPIENFDRQRVDASGLEFNYYNADIHTAAFALPTFQRKRFET